MFHHSHPAPQSADTRSLTHTSSSSSSSHAPFINSRSERGGRGGVMLWRLLTSRDKKTDGPFLETRSPSRNEIVGAHTRGRHVHFAGGGNQWGRSLMIVPWVLAALLEPPHRVCVCVCRGGGEVGPPLTPPGRGEVSVPFYAPNPT